MKHKNNIFTQMKNSPASKLEAKRKREEKKRLQETLAPLNDFLDICYRKYATSEYKTGTKCGNMIGDRIRHILWLKEMTVLELAKKSGVGRSSLQRYLEKNPDSKKTHKEESKDKFPFPRAITLYKVLQALNCEIADFVESPENYAQWENNFENGYFFTISPHDEPNDYYGWKESVKFSLKRRLAYSSPKGYRYVPNHIVETLTAQIYQAFDIADKMLEYEIKVSEAKGQVPIKEIEIDD